MGWPPFALIRVGAHPRVRAPTLRACSSFPRRERPLCRSATRASIVSRKARPRRPAPRGRPPMPRCGTRDGAGHPHAPLFRNTRRTPYPVILRPRGRRIYFGAAVAVISEKILRFAQDDMFLDGLPLLPYTVGAHTQVRPYAPRLSLVPCGGRPIFRRVSPFFVRFVKSVTLCMGISSKAAHIVN